MRLLSYTPYTRKVRSSLAVVAFALLLSLSMLVLPTTARAEEAGAPVETPIETPVETPIETPVEVLGEAYDETTTETPVETPDETTPETITTSSGTDLNRMGNDYVWAGDVLSLDGAEVQNDVLAAGQSLLVKGCKVGGDVRMAGQNVRLADATVQENVTLAGQNVIVEDSQANAVALAGQTAEFSGTCSGLSVFASNVIIDGTVEGDVTVGANAVTVGPHAHITGTLHIEAAQEPVIEEGAQINNIEVTTSDEDDVAAGQADVVASGLADTFGLFINLVGAVGTVIIALCAEWLFGRHTKAAAAMARNRAGAVVASGVVGMLAAPIACILLCLFVVTLPAALCVVLAMLAMAAAASGFAAASLAKLAFPRLGRFAGASAGGAIVGIAKAIPVLGILVRVAAFVYLVGYVLQSIYLGMSTDDADPQTEPAPASEGSALPKPPTEL